VPFGMHNYMGSQIRGWMPFLFAGLASILVAIAIAAIDYSNVLRREAGLREHASSEAYIIQGRLEELLDSPVLRTRGLVAQIIAHGDVSPATFRTVAEVLIGGQSDVRNITLSRGTVIAMVHPLAGNEGVIGTDYRSIPTQWPTVERAIANNTRVMQGPFELIQGGSGLIVREPVFLPQPGGEGRFFGIVSVILDIDGIFRDAGLYRDDLPIEVAIRGKDGLGAAGGMVLGNETLFSQTPVMLDVRLPYGNWQLAAIPRGGWGEPSSALTPIRALEGTLFLLTILASVAIARQIHLRTTVNRTLLASEEKLRNLYELSPLGIALTDMQGRFIEFNDAFRQICGYLEDELKALDYWELTPKEYADDEARQLESLRDTARYGPYEKEYRRKDGTRIPLRLNGMLVTGLDGRKYIWSIVEDISERKRSEAVLALSEERYRGLIESQSDLIVRIGMDGRFTFVNGAVAAALGKRPEDVVGTPWQALIVAADHADTAEAIAEAAGPGRRATVVSRMILAGGVRWVAWEGGAIIDASENVIEVQAVGRDVTEWVTYREQLKQLVRELDASNRELEQFAYVASHDLQTPLRNIVSYTQLLERRYKGLLDTDADDFIGFIVANGKHMTRLINDLLDFSRISRQSEPPHPTPAGEAVSQALQNLKLELERADAELKFGELPIVMADHLHLVSLFQNLLGNGLKYRSSDRRPVLSVSAERESSELWRFAVADNGIGIEPDYHDKIFEIFQRLDPASSVEGTGIGLTLCRRIIHRFGGEIWVESQPNEGSTFFFTLPDGSSAT
jgi:two-component system, sensor histidine kinase and response regulator